MRTGQRYQPALLLICSSLEAGFKAYLHHNKVSLDRLRDRFRHDLANCMPQCGSVRMQSLLITSPSANRASNR